MTETVRTPAVKTDGLDGGLSISGGDILEKLWRTFTSMRTALVLILCLAFLGLIGTLLIQAPSGLARDPQSYAGWLETIRPRFGGWTFVMDKLGLFDIFNSIEFKGILVLLTTSVLACSVNRFRGLMKTAVNPRMKMTPTFYERAPHRAAIASTSAPSVLVGDVKRVFGARHFRTVVIEDGDTTHVYADRFRWAPFGTLLAHISLILILLGALVGGQFGFRNSNFSVPVGSKVDVGNGTGLTVEALRFSDTYSTENGAPSDYASDLVVYRGGVQVASQTVRVNAPLRVDGITFYQSYLGPAADLRVTDASGTVLFDQGVPLEWGSTDGKHAIGQMNLPTAGLVVNVVEPSSGEVDPTIKAGQAQLDIFSSNNQSVPVGSTLLTQGQPATVAGLTYTFVRERQFTGLIAASDPGAVFVWLGAILLVSGISLVFFFQNRRIWAAIRRTPDGSEVVVGATTRHDATFGSDFQRLVSDLQLAVTKPSAA